MLRSVKAIVGYILRASDGDIGSCKDFLFDDRQWTIRYMVADTGSWLPGRKVLISPTSLSQPDWRSHRFPVILSMKQIEEAPDLDKDAPVSRQHEIELHKHYGNLAYWGGTGLWGEYSVPVMLRAPEGEPPEEPVETGDSHLRSTTEVTGYHVAAADNRIGHVEDFIVNDETWSLRYLVVNTRTWLKGHSVLISPDWIESVSWGNQEVSVGHTSEEIENSPEYDPAAPINIEYEARLYDYYGRPHAWR